MSPSPKIAYRPDEAVYAWAFESSGHSTTYETMLRADGTVSCSCPGWIIFKRKADVRTCKHTKEIADAAEAMMIRVRNGERIPRPVRIQPIAVQLEERSIISTKRAVQF